MSSTYGDGGWRIGRRTLVQAVGLTGLAAAISGSAAAQPAGPPRTSRFLVEIDGIAVQGFSRVELPTAAIEELAYREGSEDTTTRELSGLTEVGRLVLEKGVGPGSRPLYDWFEAVQHDGAGAHTRSLAVVLLDARGDEVARWLCFEAWPATYDPPGLDARSADVAVERFELVVGRLERVD